MDLGSRVSRTRCALVWALVSAGCGLLVAGLLPVVTAGRPDVAGSDFEDLLVRGCGAVGLAATCWLWLGATLTTLDATRGRLVSRRGVPDGVRRLVAALCGAALVSGLAAPALAADPGAASGSRGLAGLQLPERVSVAPAAHRSDGPAAPAARDRAHAVAEALPPHLVVVRPGDTLWGLAAEQLGPGTPAAEVAASWPLIYAANRDRIGPDPDLIRTGQRLVLPGEADEAVTGDAR